MADVGGGNPIIAQRNQESRRIIRLDKLEGCSCVIVDLFSTGSENQPGRQFPIIKFFSGLQYPLQNILQAKI